MVATFATWACCVSVFFPKQANAKNAAKQH